MKLLLFDVDGTLIVSDRAGIESMTLALQEVFGTAGPVNGYAFAGKTDAQIVTDLMVAAGIAPEQIRQGLSRVFARMADHGRRLFTPARLRPLPGALALLSALGQRPDCLLGLLTGNSALTAPLKLQGAGLDPAQFRLGAYGSDHADRDRLPDIARARARSLTGRGFPGRELVVIGDTPADVACARAADGLAVAVATGHYTLDQLSLAGPDLLLPDLRDTRGVLNAIFTTG